MSKRAKAERQQAQAEQIARREEIVRRKMVKRAKQREKFSFASLPRKENTRILLDFIWRATGGPIVWVTQWFPFSKSGRD